MWAVLGLCHPGNPRASAPSGQLQTTSEHYHPAPAQLILHTGQKLVISDHGQSLQLTGLGKSLSLPTATKAQVQEEEVLSPYEVCNLSA